MARKVRNWSRALVGLTVLASCSVKRVTFEEGPPDAAPDSASPSRCELGLCVDYGTGRDGDVVMSFDRNLNTDNLDASSDRNGTAPDGVAFQVASAPTGRTIDLLGDASGRIVEGDLILLINLQGTPGDTGSVGNYEVLEVATVAGSRLTIKRDIIRPYGGVDFANQKVVVQRIPQLGSYTQRSGVLTASPWNGLAGAGSGEPLATGIVAVFVKGTLTLTGGVDVSARGFRGGVAGTRVPEDSTSAFLTSRGQDGAPGAMAAPGGKGAGTGLGTGSGGRGGSGFFAGGAAGQGGGGGGASNDNNGCGISGSGGGGGAPYASGKNPSSLAAATLTLGGSAAAGAGGGAGGTVANQAPTFTASGGHANGAGGDLALAFSRGGSGSAGGNGGGLVLIFARQLAGNGGIGANGGPGGSGGGGGGATGYDGAAGGGGGAGADGAAGGSILVRYESSTWTGTASVRGGLGGGGGGGGAGDGAAAAGGGGGGLGGGGGGGGTRTNCATPSRSASNGGAGGQPGNCGAVAPTGDSNVGGGGAAGGGGGSSMRGDCVGVGANLGGLSPVGNGSNGDAQPNGGAGGKGGDASRQDWGGGGGGGQAGVPGEDGLVSVEQFVP